MSGNWKAPSMRGGEEESINQAPDRKVHGGVWSEGLPAGLQQAGRIFVASHLAQAVDLLCPHAKDEQVLKACALRGTSPRWHLVRRKAQSRKRG